MAGKVACKRQVQKLPIRFPVSVNVELTILDAYVSIVVSDSDVAKECFLKGHIGPIITWWRQHTLYLLPQSSDF
jgi:hypothetical protein